MRKNILTDEIDPTDIVRVKITKEPETGWYIGKVDTEYDCVYDHKGNFMLVEDVKAVKDGNSFTTRIIKPDDVEIVVVISTTEKVEVKEPKLYELFSDLISKSHPRIKTKRDYDIVIKLMNEAYELGIEHTIDTL